MSLWDMTHISESKLRNIKEQKPKVKCLQILISFLDNKSPDSLEQDSSLGVF